MPIITVSYGCYSVLLDCAWRGYNTPITHEWATIITIMDTALNTVGVTPLSRPVEKSVAK